MDAIVRSGPWPGPLPGLRERGGRPSSARRYCMRNGNYLFTSESVAEGHPDKVCDRISDTVLDIFLAADPHSRVACETLATTNEVVIAGEVRGPASVTFEKLEHATRE